LALSRDGRWLAAAIGDTLIRTWDVSTGKALDEDAAVRDSSGHTGAVAAVALSPDGRTVVTAGDSSARVWDATTGVMRYAVQHGGTIGAVALSPDGSLLATSSLDDSIRLIETSTGQQRHRLRGHGYLGANRALAFTHDGTAIASWGSDAFL